jgi:hypothetical protein
MNASWNMWCHYHHQVYRLVIIDYFYAKYTDWIADFIEAFKKDKYITLPGDKEKMA